MQSIHSILIDTDIGDDVDDAFALALATRLPQLQLRGVTTVSGPVAERARLAEHILHAAGQQHIPVVPGSSTMRNGRPGPDKFSHKRVLAGSAIAGRSSDKTATELILACDRECMPLTIVALGPLTNIAAALDADPTLAGRARLVAMAGTLGTPYPDWNLRCDPGAARRVFASGIPTMLVGMQLTMHAKMRVPQVEQLFRDPHPLLQTLASCVLAWRSWHRRIPILHDALTVAIAAEPTLAQQEPRDMRVFAAGFSRAAHGARPNVQVCTAANFNQFHLLLNTHLFDEPYEAENGCL